MRHIIFKLLLSFLLMGSTSAVAQPEFWQPPAAEQVVSANGTWRFKTELGPIDAMPDNGKPGEGGAAIKPPPPTGVLARRDANGAWNIAWDGRLVHDIAPATLMVSDTGYVVTLDNWASLGRGENVVVIYDPAGRLVRTMTLAELLPQDYIDALPFNESSIRWRTKARFSDDDQQLLIDVLIPQATARKRERAVRFLVNLVDGTIVPPPEARWQAALVAVPESLAVNTARRKAQEAYMRDPLTAPAGCEYRDWSRYLDEALPRLDAPRERTRVVYQSDTTVYDEDVQMLGQVIAGVGPRKSTMIIVAPCNDAGLVYAMGKVFEKIAPGSMKEIPFYIFVGPELKTQLQPIIGPSGAKVIWIDPAEPIPQQAERIPNSPDASAGQADPIK